MNAQRQFLIVGPQRSGTTIFGEILQRHQDICLTLDGKLLYYLIVWLVKDPSARLGMHPRLDEIAHALSRRTVSGDAYSLTDKLIESVKGFSWAATQDVHSFERQVRQIWSDAYREISGGALAVGDKYNEYLLYAAEIRQLFPDMKYVVLKRERFQSARSAQRKFEGRQWQPVTQHQSEHKVDAWQRVFDTAGIPEANIHRVQFESFCADPHRTLNGVCDFLALPACHTMHGFARDVLDPERAWSQRARPVVAAAF